MSVLIPLIIILIAEFVGDFLLQSRHTALNKSKDIKVLIKHLWQIFYVLIIGTLIATKGMIALNVIVPFVALYCLIHGIQDWFIWKGYGYIVYKRFERLTKGTDIKVKPFVLGRMEKRFKEDKEYAEDKVFYDIIGLDRLLHVVTLIVLYGIFFL